MAVVFELVLDFGADKDAALNCANWLTSKVKPVQIDEFCIAIHPPRLDHCYPFSNPKFQVSIIPAKVGCHVAIDRAWERLRLTGHQLSRLGAALYDRLRGAPNYQLAMVGWDVDYLLDIEELNLDWAKEIQDGSFDGLVVQNSLRSLLPSSSHFVDFDGDHVWIPYRGSKVIN